MPLILPANIDFIGRHITGKNPFARNFIGALAATMSNTLPDRTGLLYLDWQPFLARFGYK